MNVAAVAAPFAGVAVAVFVASILWRDGGYYAGAAGVAGTIVVALAAAAYMLGWRAARPVAGGAGALVALGLWSVASTGWGGLPHTSWRFLGLMIAAAGALVLGSMVGAAISRRALIGGVAGGVTLVGAVCLAVLAAGTAPDDWFIGRQFAGPIGYHNAQAAACVVALPLALWLASARLRGVRAAAAASAVSLTAILLLTQSRGALVAAIAAVGLQILLSRRLRLALTTLGLAGCGAFLFSALSDVDRALASRGSVDAIAPAAEHALTRFAVITALCAIALAAAATPSVPAVRLRRRVVTAMGATAGAVILAGAVAAAVYASHRSDDLLARVRQEPNVASQTPGGATRYSSLSTSGRVPQWRVALRMIEESPVRGAGTGSFARRFGVERNHKDLYVLQPHSLELELLAELGVVGLGLFLAFGVATALGLRRGDRQLVAAVGAALAGFLLVASFDWVFSFAGLLVPLLLAVGSAAKGARMPVPSLPSAAAVLLAVVLAAAVLIAPGLAERRLAHARDLEARSVPDAWREARRARDLAAWDPRIVSYQGWLAERLRQYEVAADLYRRAAELSPQPWTDTFRRARALRSAGRRRESRAACLLAYAQNPLEPALTRGVCDD